MSLLDRQCAHCGLTIRQTIALAVALAMKGRNAADADCCRKNGDKEHEFGDDPFGAVKQHPTKVIR